MTLTTSAAANRKGCTRQAINNAIRRGEINATRHGRAWVIADDAALAAWSVKETGGRAHKGAGQSPQSPPVHRGYSDSARRSQRGAGDDG